MVHFIIYLVILGLILALAIAYGKMNKEDRKFWRSAVGRVLWGLIFLPPTDPSWEGPEDLRSLLLKHTVAKTEPDEEIITYAVVSGVTIQDTGQGLHGILSAAVQRLIFAYRNKRNKAAIQLVSFPYNVISDLETMRHAFAPEIRFLAAGKMVGLRLAVDKVEDMVRIIEEGMSGRTPRVNSEL